MCLLGVILSVVFSSDSLAQNLGRQVIVNGELLNGMELRLLDALNCQTLVPNGRYWLNGRTGAWGYEGGPQVSVVGAQCAPNQPRARNHKSECELKYRFHEDRMCYCYNVCVNLSTN
jgi:hypothetical protein